MKKTLWALALALCAGAVLGQSGTSGEKTSGEKNPPDLTATLVTTTAPQAAWTLFGNCTSSSAPPLFNTGGTCTGFFNAWAAALATTATASGDLFPFFDISDNDSGKRVTRDNLFAQTFDGVTMLSTARVAQMLVNKGGDPLQAIDVNTETDVVENSTSGATIPNNTLGTHSKYRITVSGRYLNNSGGNDTITFKVYFGATNAWGSVTGNLATSAAYHAFVWQFYLAAGGATNKQRLHGFVSMGGGSGSVAGLGSFSGVAIGYVSFSHSTATAIDSTSGTNKVRATMQLTGGNGTTIRADIHDVLIEYLPAP